MNRRLAVPPCTVVAVSGCGVGVHFADYRHRLTTDARVSGPVEIVEVNEKVGHVNITSGGSDVTIHRAVRYESGTPHPGQRLDAGRLTFTRGCSRCAVDYDLTVPSSVDVRIHVDSGAVDVTLPGGPYVIDAHSDPGATNVSQVPQAPSAPRRLSLRTDSGDLTVEPS